MSDQQKLKADAKPFIPKQKASASPVKDNTSAAPPVFILNKLQSNS